MRQLQIVLSLILFSLFALPAFGADTFVIDKTHSSVEFKVSHMVVAKVTGKFTDFSGTIQYDEKNFKNWAISGSIKVTSVDTNDKQRDDHLRSPDFFDVEKHPEITFKSKNIVKKGDGYVCIGDFTLRGVTKEIKVPFTITGTITDPWGNKRLGLEASLTINRQDYGVSFNKTLETGGLVVGNDVDISLFVEAVHNKEEMKK